MKRLCKRLIQLDILLCILSACADVGIPSPGHMYQCEGHFVCPDGLNVLTGVTKICGTSLEDAEGVFIDRAYAAVDTVCTDSRVEEFSCEPAEGRCARH